MDISSDYSGVANASLGNEIAIRVAKLGQDAAKAQGDAAIALLASAAKVAAAAQDTAPGSLDVTA